MTKAEIAKIVNELKPHIEAAIRQAIAEGVPPQAARYPKAPAEREQTAADVTTTFMENLKRPLYQKRQAAAPGVEVTSRPNSAAPRS
jgi:hypothetical protein